MMQVLKITKILNNSPFLSNIVPNYDNQLKRILISNVIVNGKPIIKNNYIYILKS
jgi:hypothetical protein